MFPPPVNDRDQSAVVDADRRSSLACALTEFDNLSASGRCLQRTASVRVLQAPATPQMCPVSVQDCPASRAAAAAGAAMRMAEAARAAAGEASSPHPLRDGAAHQCRHRADFLAVRHALHLHVAYNSRSTFKQPQPRY